MDFGTSTWDLEEKFEAPREEHEFYKGETFSLSKPARLGGLEAFEKTLIEKVMSGEPGSTGEDKLKEFSQADGYLTYFSHKPSGRQFIQAGYFPGDNEYGLVAEIKVSEAGTEVSGIIAKIIDGAYGPLPGAN